MVVRLRHQPLLTSPMDVRGRRRVLSPTLSAMHRRRSPIPRPAPAAPLCSRSKPWIVWRRARSQRRQSKRLYSSSFPVSCEPVRPGSSVTQVAESNTDAGAEKLSSLASAIYAPKRREYESPAAASVETGTVCACTCCVVCDNFGLVSWCTDKPLSIKYLDCPAAALRCAGLAASTFVVV